MQLGSDPGLLPAEGYSLQTMSEHERFRYWSHRRQSLGKRGTTLSGVLRAVVAVYSSHPSGPLSLFARVRSFSAQGFRKLEQDRLALRVPAMRKSVYLVPTETARSAVAATLPSPDDPYWQKRYSHKGRAIPEDKYSEWREQILKLATRPLGVAELNVCIPNIKPVLNRMAFEGGLLRVGAEGLRSNAIRYVATRSWAPEHRLRNDLNEKSLEWLAGEYLRAFGPARREDFSWWAGVTSTKAKTAIASHETITIVDRYLLPAGDIEEFESHKKPKKDVLDLLPQWDCYTMGYAPDGRERFVDSDMLDQVYGSLGATGGNALGVVLLNGLVLGSWKSRFKGQQMLVFLNMFGKPTRRLGEQIETRFNKMATLLGARTLTVDKMGR